MVPRSYRVPWLFDDEACDVVRQFTKLKCRLMPYLYGAAVEAHEHGTPVLRPMMLEFPEDPACDTLDRQYMLGDKLLVAPVFTKAGDVRYYLPNGTWENLLTGDTVEGNCWQREKHGFMTLPLMVRPGTVLPLGKCDTRPDYDYADGVELHVYHLDGGRDSGMPHSGAGWQYCRNLYRDHGERRTTCGNGRDEALYSCCTRINILA